MTLSLILLSIASPSASGMMAQAASAAPASIDERDPAHPKYKDCKPPKNFSKRFSKTTLEKAIDNSSTGISHEKPGPLEQKNPVTGAGVTSNDVYATTIFGFVRYGYDHTYAGISQKLGEEKKYSIYVSNTNYSAGSKRLILNDLAEIYLSQGGAIKTVPLTYGGENGFCSWTGANKLDTCFSTATGQFDVDAATFQALADADPVKPIIVTSKRRDGTMSACPLYYSPLSFKAPLSLIDAQYNRAVAKRERQKAEGF